LRICEGEYDTAVRRDFRSSKPLNCMPHRAHPFAKKCERMGHPFVASPPLFQKRGPPAPHSVGDVND
jgi:hypothetical protein